MLQVVPKWKLVVTLEGDPKPTILYISETHLSNVLRTAAQLDFERPVVSLSIGPAGQSTQQRGVAGI